jgi:hypothetical protein
MKRFYCAFVLSAAILLFAAENDPKFLVDHLNRSSSEFIRSLEGVSAAQWSFKSAPEVWSIAECAEHIVLSEGLLRDLVQNKVLAAPAPQPGSPKASDDDVLKMITDRSTKAKAPEQLKPSGQFTGPEVARQKFLESREKTIAFAKSRTDLREHAVPHQVLKQMDGYQWLLYLSGHSMRHTAQIQEVKANPKYPK